MSISANGTCIECQSSPSFREDLKYELRQEVINAVLLFKNEILETLTTIKVDVADTKSGTQENGRRLDRLNGSVARHEEAIGKLQAHVASRQNSCPVADTMLTSMKVDIEEIRSDLCEVKEYITAQKASTQTSSTWVASLKPAILFLAGMIGLLILQHSSELLKAMGK